MKGVLAIGLLIVSYLLTVDRRRREKLKHLNDQIKRSNKEIENLQLRVTKLIEKYER